MPSNDPALTEALRVLRTAVDMPRDFDARVTRDQAAAVVRRWDEMEAQLTAYRVTTPTLRATPTARRSA